MEYFDKMFSTDPQKFAAMPLMAIAEEKQKLRKRPSLYEVVLLNNGTTPMEFVVVILETVFNKSEEEALDLTLETHQQGEASCGIFTRDVAETKLTRVIDMARANGFPLKCILHRH